MFITTMIQNQRVEWRKFRSARRPRDTTRSPRRSAPRARGRPAAHAGDPQGARPHTEQALCAEFGVSRTTIRQALAVLKREGLLESRRGVGTRFVPAAPEPKYTRSHGDPLHAALGSKPRLVSRKVVRAPDPVVEFLGLGEEKALRLVRINDLKGAPLSVVVSYLPGRLANAITRSELRRSVHEVLWRRCGLRQKRSVHTIDVESARTPKSRCSSRSDSRIPCCISDPECSSRTARPSGGRTTTFAKAATSTPPRWSGNRRLRDLVRHTTAQSRLPSKEEAKMISNTAPISAAAPTGAGAAAPALAGCSSRPLLAAPGLSPGGSPDCIGRSRAAPAGRPA